jgi:integrase
MASIFKRHKSGRWIIEFTDHDGVRRNKSSHTTDHRVAQQIANEIEAAVAQRRAGLVDPRAEAAANDARRPILEHVDAFEAVMRARGRTAEHVATTAQLVRRVLDAAKVTRLPELTASRVQTAIDEIRIKGALPRAKPKPPKKRRKPAANATDPEAIEAMPVTTPPEPLSNRTSNKLAVAIKSFSHWLVRDGRMVADPLASVTLRNLAVDRRRRRRALTADESRKLIAAANRSPNVLGLSGPDRAMLYRLAVGTGFRVSELASLRRESFDLAGEPPTVTVAAAYAKSRREDRQPLQAELAKVVAAWLPSRSPFRPLFDVVRLAEKSARMIRTDLATAEIDEIDAEGRVIDFHALRHTFVTAVVNSGASPKECQTLARHADPSLTFKVYAHTRLHDLTRIVDALPDMSAPVSNAVAKTGTDDATPKDRQRKRQHSQHRDTPPDSAQCRTDASDALAYDDSKSFEDAGLCHSVPDDSTEVQSGPARTRTENQGIMSPLL